MLFTIPSSTSIGVSDDTRKEIIKKLEKQKCKITNKITNINKTSKDSVRRINILIDFANRLPELIFTALAELATRQIAESENATGME